MLIRDGPTFSLLWQSCFRGCNAGELRLDSIVLPTEGNTLPYLLPKLVMKAGAKMHVKPDHTKNKREWLPDHPDLFSMLTILPVAEACSCPVCHCRPTHYQLPHQTPRQGHKGVFRERQRPVMGQADKIPQSLRLVLRPECSQHRCWYQKGSKIPQKD